MTGIDSDTHKAILRAVCDPGSITEREPGESVQHWEARAVEEFAGPYIAAAEAKRLRELAERAEAAYLEFCDQKPYCTHGDHMKPFADLIGDGS